jgi:hypothetical protein
VTLEKIFGTPAFSLNFSFSFPKLFVFMQLPSNAHLAEKAGHIVSARSIYFNQLRTPIAHFSWKSPICNSLQTAYRGVGIGSASADSHLRRTRLCAERVEKEREVRLLSWF